MRKSFFTRFIMITTAAVLVFSVSGCGKKKPNNESATTEVDVIRETGDIDPNEETTSIEEQDPIGHVREGDRAWLDETLYTDEERVAMQFTIDGKTYGYDEFLEVTNTDFACWRYYYRIELDDLKCSIRFANIADSEKSDLWKNTIYPKLQDEEEFEKIRKQIREDAVAMVAGMSQDDNGLISKGKTAGYTAYVFDDNSGVGKPCITDDDAIAADIRGIVTNARCAGIIFNPEDPNGLATATVVFTFVTNDPLGEAYDLEMFVTFGFVYIENEDKWMAYSIGDPKGDYVVYEEDGKIDSSILALDDEVKIGSNYIIIEGPEYGACWHDRTFIFGDHFWYYNPYYEPVQ